MIVGRLFVLILVAVSILWIPIIQASQGMALTLLFKKTLIVYFIFIQEANFLIIFKV
jgi:hypothetical protein